MPCAPALETAVGEKPDSVDNSPASPHYGRLYVGYTKFHMLPSGFSDYCPLQLSYTDTVNMNNPSLTAFQHTAIQPDNPGGDGTGPSARQARPDGSARAAGCRPVRARRRTCRP